MKLCELERSGIKYWVVDTWQEKGIVHGFIGRDINLLKGVNQWQEAFKDEAIADSSANLLLLRQCHGSEVIQTPANISQIPQMIANPPEGDAWLHRSRSSTAKQIYLGIKTADCFPVILVHPQFVAACHCGWRGAVNGLLPKVILMMIDQGANPKQIEIAIGPGAQVEEFEIGADVISEFSRAELALTKEKLVKNNHPVLVQKDKKFFGDIRQLLTKQALSTGVESENIVASEISTIGSLDFFFPST